MSLQYQLCHGHRKGSVGSWYDWHPHIRHFSHSRPARIYDNQLRAPLFRLQDCPVGGQRAGIRLWIFSPAENNFTVSYIFYQHGLRHAIGGHGRKHAGGRIADGTRPHIVG